MPGPPMPPPFDEIGQRRFSFYPSIANAEPNEWLFRSASWSEVQVINVRTNQEVWIPRQYLGTLSDTDDPVLIVGLTKELEWKAGAVWPRVKRVIEIPRAVNDVPMRPRLPLNEPKPPASIVGIKLEGRTESKAGRLILYAGVATVLVSLLVLVVFRDWVFAPRISYRPVVETSLGLSISDDYNSVVDRLGKPASDRWQTEKGALQFRALSYPQQKLHVILMGQDRRHMRYIGAMDDKWQVVDAVRLGRKADSSSLLGSLPKF
jgi:hypothetical protein